MTPEKRTEGEEIPNQIRWTIHETHRELVETIRTKLSEVIDPEIGFDIIQLGLVRDFLIISDTGVVRMVLTTPFCPYGPEMIEMTKIKAEVGLGKPVKVEMLPDIWSPMMMEDPSLMDWGMMY